MRLLSSDSIPSEINSNKESKVIFPLFDKCSLFNVVNCLGELNLNNPEFVYNNQFPNFFFYHIQGFLPNRIDFNNLSPKIIDYFNDKNFELIKKEYNTKYNDHIALFFERTKNIIYYLMIGEDDAGIYVNVQVFGDFNVDETVKFFKEYKRQEDNTKFEIGLIKSSEFGFDISWFGIDKPKIDIELNYGTEFAEKHYPQIVNKLNGKKSGLILLSSKPGMGKSFFIKHLASIVGRKFIYLSESVLSQGLDSPTLIEILTMNRGCVVVIEDAEKFLISREENPNSFVSNLLNASDGILGDILDFRLILTHNMTKLERLDGAILRKGRCLYQHEFKPLSVIEANKKLEQLKVDYKTNKPMTLAEIYNLDENGVVESEKENRIGFK
jgi:hypothetical protein